MADETWLCWLDFETTGLDTERCAPLEYSVQITTFDDPLNVIAHTGAIITVPDEDMDAMDDVARAMHETSGLLTDLTTAGIPELDAQVRLREFVRYYVHVAPRLLLAGSGVRFDWDLCNMRWGRHVLAPLHYRQIDVSVPREIAQSVGAPVYERNRPHRAVDDVDDSRLELEFYRAQIYYRGGGQ